MDSILTTIAGEQTERAFSATACMTLEHLGSLFTFMAQNIGALAIFDPERKPEEMAIREAIKVGKLVCQRLVEEGAQVGVSPEEMRSQWEALVQEVVRQSEGT